MGLKGLARKTVGAIAAACSRDSDLRSRVQADPKLALAEEGMELPFDEVKVVEDTPETMHVPLTAPGSEMSDEQMETVVGGLHSSVTGMQRQQMLGSMVMLGQMSLEEARRQGFQ